MENPPARFGGVGESGSFKFQWANDVHYSCVVGILCRSETGPIV